MPKLENPKHDEFARLLAQGVKQGEAYIKAGYSPNKGAASRLAQSPKVQDRVDEIRKEIDVKVQQAMMVPSEENWQSLADMGLNFEWVAVQYKLIYEKSLEAGSFSAANTAVQNIQKLVEMEKNGTSDESENSSSKISVQETLSLLEGMRGLLDSSNKEPEYDMFDITPEESE